MNRCIFIHRLTGPAILLLIGTIALLHQAHLASWNLFVPLLLILIGVIKLAERAALAAEPNPPASPYSGSAYPGTPYVAAPGAVPPAPSTQPTGDFGNHSEGGSL